PAVPRARRPGLGRRWTGRGAGGAGGTPRCPRRGAPACRRRQHGADSGEHDMNTEDEGARRRPAARGFPRVAVPSRGRLRTRTLELLEHAGYSPSMLHGGGAIARVDGLVFIEMRSRDAAAALAAGQVAAAFIATDLITEHQLEDLPALPLGFARS